MTGPDIVVASQVCSYMAERRGGSDLLLWDFANKLYCSLRFPELAEGAVSNNPFDKPGRLSHVVGMVDSRDAVLHFSVYYAELPLMSIPNNELSLPVVTSRV